MERRRGLAISSSFLTDRRPFGYTSRAGVRSAVREGSRSSGNLCFHPQIFQLDSAERALLVCAKIIFAQMILE
jgi:hypothetical protein